MADLTQKDKQAIVDAIEVIFNGAVYATPDQITDEVADMVTKIINEISSATKKIKYTYGGVFSILYLGLPVTGIIAGIQKLLLGQLLALWFREITQYIGLRSSLVTAAARWRSPIELALMGL
jgi:hypothetical protein